MVICFLQSEDPYRDAIKSSTNGCSFIDGWKCIGSGRFGNLKEFCGGLATVFPGTATVESDFSIVNYERNDYKTNLWLGGYGTVWCILRLRLVRRVCDSRRLKS